MTKLTTALIILAFYASCQGTNPLEDLSQTNARRSPHSQQENDLQLARRLYQDSDQMLMNAFQQRSQLNAEQWFRTPFQDTAKSRISKTEKFVSQVLKLKQVDRKLYQALRDKALTLADAQIPQHDSKTGELRPTILFLKLLFEDKQTWISYVKEKSGYDHHTRGGDRYDQGTSDRRFQDAMAPLLVQLDKSIVQELTPLFAPIYAKAGKKYLLRDHPPGIDISKSDGQGPKRLIDSFVRYTSLPEYAFMKNFTAAQKRGHAPEFAAGQAYEAYLAEVRRVSGFSQKISPKKKGSALGVKQADYDTEVMARILFRIQDTLRTNNSLHAPSYHAIQIIGGSFARGTSTLGGWKMEKVTKRNGQVKEERPGSDIDTLIKLRNGKYIGLQNRERGMKLAELLTGNIRKHLNTNYSPKVIYNLQVNDDKLSRYSFVRQLNEFDLSKINPFLIEVGQDHICLIIHNYRNSTVSNLEIRQPGVMVFPIQSHFHKVAGRKPVRNGSKCLTQRREPWSYRP